MEQVSDDHRILLYAFLGEGSYVHITTELGEYAGELIISEIRPERIDDNPLILFKSLEIDFSKSVPESFVTKEPELRSGSVT